MHEAAFNLLFTYKTMDNTFWNKITSYKLFGHTIFSKEEICVADADAISENLTLDNAVMRLIMCIKTTAVVHNVAAVCYHRVRDDYIIL